jgi:TP901-1 family phage major tail protein
MAKVNGKAILVSVKVGTNYVPIAGSRSCKLSLSQAVIDVTTKDSNSWKDLLPGLREWSVEVENLVDFSVAQGFEQSLDVLLSQGTTLLQIGLDGGGANFVLQGTAILSSLSAEAPNESEATWSATFEGTGVLAKVSV